MPSSNDNDAKLRQELTCPSMTLSNDAYNLSLEPLILTGWNRYITENIFLRLRPYPRDECDTNPNPNATLETIFNAIVGTRKQ